MLTSSIDLKKANFNLRLLEFQNEIIQKQLEEGVMQKAPDAEEAGKLAILKDDLLAAEERNKKLQDEMKEMEAEIVTHKENQE